MRPDTGNPLSLSPFRTTIPLPVQDPDGEPTGTYTIACSWLPYIRGALMAATMQYTWPQDDPAAVLLAQQRVMTLISMFSECGDAIPPISCGYDFRFSDTGWELVPGFDQGFYAAGVGFVGTTGGPSDHGEVYIRHLLTTPNIITSIDFSYDGDFGGAGSDSFAGILVDTGAGPVIVSSTGLNAGLNNQAWSGSISDVVGIYIAINAGTNSVADSVFNAHYNGLSVNGCE